MPFFLFALALSVSSEVPLTTSNLYQPAPGAQTEPAVASNGRDFFAVWTDRRAGTADLYGARIAANGTVLDPDSIALPSTFDADQSPAVVWNGSAYLVVSAAGPQFGFGLRGTEVLPDGSLGTSRTIIEGTLLDPAIAWNGAAYLLAWNELTGEQRVQAMLVDRNLNALTPPVTLGVGDAPSVATNGSGFLVTWRERRVRSETAYATITATGAIESAPVVLGPASAAPSVASDANDYAIAWSTPVRVTRIGTRGERLRDLDLPRPVSVVDPRIHWTGTRYVILWTAVREEVMGAEVDSSLTTVRLLGAPLEVIGNPVLATNGERTLFVAIVAGRPEQDVSGWLDEGEVFPIATSLPAQLPMAAAVSPRGIAGTVWLENDSRLMFGRSDGGRPLDGDGIHVDDGFVSYASVAATAQAFAVVYTVREHSYAVRFAHDGRRIDAQPLLLGTGVPAIAIRSGVATDGQTFMAVFSNDFRVEGLLLPPVGPAGVRRVISAPPENSVDIPYDIAWNGSEYVVAVGTWNTARCGSRICTFSAELALVRIDREVAVLGKSPAGQVGASAAIALTAHGSRLFVARNGPVATVQRFTATGEPIDAAPVPFVEFTFFAEVVRAGGRDVLVTVVSREGTVRIFASDVDAPDAEPQLIATRASTQRIAVASTPHGSALLVYSQPIQRHPEAHPEGVPRAVIRFLGTPRARVTSR